MNQSKYPNKGSKKNDNAKTIDTPKVRKKEIDAR